MITPPSNAVFIAEQIKGAWLAQFEGAGHGVINQESYKVAQLIKLFLSDYSFDTVRCASSLCKT